MHPNSHNPNSKPGPDLADEQGLLYALTKGRYSVTVIVCTRDRPVLLEACLRSLSRQTYSGFDVLVVDNAPARSARAVCDRWAAAWVPAPVPGLTRARNIGARMARGDLIAYIDDDAVAEADWLEALVDGFGDPAVAGVTGRVRYMKALGDTLAMSGEESTEDSARPQGSFNSGVRDWFALACFGGIGDGGNMAFRRRVIVSEVAFDERLGRGRLLDCGDEHVVFASLIARGHCITHSPVAIVRHPCPPTPVLRQARRYRELRTSIAYLVFLWNEFPAHRGHIRRFLQRALAKRVVPSKSRTDGRAHLPRTRALWAMLGGLAVYWRARREWSEGPLQRRDIAIEALPGFIEPSSNSR